MQAFDPTYGPFAQQQIEQLSRIGDQQSELGRELAHVRQEIGTSLNASNLPGGRTVVQDALEAALDAEIDQYRDILRDGKPKTALGLCDALLLRVHNTASGRIVFRIKANIGHCHLLLGDNVRAAHWLSEAFVHAPAEPKAIANKALSILLQERFKQAYEYGYSELQQDPTNQWLAPYVIQAIARCEDLDDPLSKIPEELREQEDIQTAYVHFLRYRNRLPDWWIAARAASAAHPDHKILLQFKAEADLDEVGHTKELEHGARLSPEVREKVGSATKILRDLWEKRRLSEFPGLIDNIVACCNLLAAYTLLGKTTEAFEVAKQAISIAPDDKNVIERAAIAAIEAGDYGFAEPLLPKLPQSADATLVKFQFYTHQADWSKITEIAKEANRVPEHERPSLITMGRLAALMAVARGNKDHDELKAILDATPDDIRSYVSVSQFAHRLGILEISDEAYGRAVTLAQKQRNALGILMLARLAGQREDWRTIIDLLDNYVELNIDSEELSLLATAFVNENPTRKRALAFFSNLDPSILSLPVYRTAYGLLQSKRGDLPAAAEAFERVLSDKPTNLTALRNLCSVYFRQERSDRSSLIKKRLEQITLSDLKGPAEDKMALTHILREIGESRRALEWAYEIVRSNRNDPNVALAYFGLIIGHGDTIEIPPANVIGADTWVSLKNNLGETQNLLIENGPDRPADGVYSPSHAFVTPALGLKVGESFTQTRHVGRPETWTVVEIKHKYLHALHDIMDSFNIRFPEEHGLYRITTAGGDISPILDQVKTHSEHSQALVDLYTQQKIPLVFIAAMTRTEVIKFALGVTQFGGEIIACYGNAAERAASERLTRDYASKGAVLDCYTAWIVEGIGIFPALKILFGKLFIPRSAIDEVAKMQQEFSQPGKQMTVTYRDGQYFRDEISEEEAARRMKGIAERRQKIEQYCEVVPVDIPDNISDLARGLIDESRPHVLDPAFLASEKDALLVSDDLYFRQTAQQACGTKGIFLQSAITIAADRKLIEKSTVANAIVGLASLHHSHVSLSADALAEIAKIDDTDRQLKFRAAAEYIGTKSAEIYSHVNAVAKFLDKVWGLNIPDLSKAACSGILIEQLLRFRTQDYRQIVGTLRSELRHSWRATEYLEAWVRGHFGNI